MSPRQLQFDVARLAGTSSAPLQPRDRGAVYTPPLLACFLAERVAARLRTPSPTVADLACGDGALLEAIADVLPHARLRGADIDADAVAACAQRLPHAEVARYDVVGAVVEAGLEALDTVDAVVLNPPWGCRFPWETATLRDAGLTVARGQWDSFGLFVEIAAAAVREGGVLGLVLPEAILGDEHARVRDLLHARCDVHEVVRLGEGFFPGVYRSTVVVVASRRARPAPDHPIELAALRHDLRRQVLGGRTGLDEALAHTTFHLPCATILADSQRRWPTTAGSAGAAGLLLRMSARAGDWNAWVTSGRGVELSKHGIIVACPACAIVRPAPRRPGAAPATCTTCGAQVQTRAVTAPHNAAPRDWLPLISGEDVGRYRATPSRRIEPGLSGLRYKTEALGAPRLLVRKTGVGLHIAIEDGTALTTQTVLHLTPTPLAPTWALGYLLGVLASRVILAWSLVRFGEGEWRSHPYLTQQRLLELPLPTPAAEDGETNALAQEIAELALERAGRVDRGLELALEARVARLFQLDEEDLAAAAAVLDAAQPLAAIVLMRFRPDDLPREALAA